MQNSIIFSKPSKSAKHGFISYDCCESLGNLFRDRFSYSHVMYVGIPTVEMNEFFFIENNLDSYMELITKAYNINYSVATEEERKDINYTSCKYTPEDLIVIRISSDKLTSNKYFNVAYNTMRYLWYQHYTNMAIIATNLYRLELLDDPMDILAIAFSFQETESRAVLPMRTSEIEGLLFFRPFSVILKELESNTLFNTVFYKYPIYFNPKVKITGSFFSDVEVILEAKEIIARLIGVLRVDEIPGSMRNNLRLICKDYLEMKSVYLKLIKEISYLSAAMDKNVPLLLSTDLKQVKIDLILPTGVNKRTTFDI